jgi:hypothetical protein
MMVCMVWKNGGFFIFSNCNGAVDALISVQGSELLGKLKIFGLKMQILGG